MTGPDRSEWTANGIGAEGEQAGEHARIRLLPLSDLRRLAVLMGGRP